MGVTCRYYRADGREGDGRVWDDNTGSRDAVQLRLAEIRAGEWISALGLAHVTARRTTFVEVVLMANASASGANARCRFARN